MSSYPTCSLVISTYNWPEALELILLSIKTQSYLPKEVIIGDDGSSKKTEVLIQKIKEQFPIPLYHIWQKDNGNRKAIIMNKAIAKASHEYIIQIDGDIILHKDFIKDHITMAEKGIYLYGSRANIQKQYLKTLFKKKQIYFNFFSKGIKKRGRLIRIPLLAGLYKKEDKRSSKFRGCNVSFWRKDFIDINGYNEVFKGWGMEDSEMIERLINNGIYGKRLKYRGLAYHIHHNEQDRNKVPSHMAIERETVEKKITFTKIGVDQYL